MKKVKYKIKGFDCPACAIKVEDHLKKDENINDVSINFSGQTMNVKYHDKEYTLDELKKIIKEVESDEIEIENHENKRSEYKVQVFDKDTWKTTMKVLIVAFLLILGVIFEHLLPGQMGSWRWFLMLGTYLIAYTIISYDYLWKTLKNFKRWQTIFDETTLMVIASLGALIIGAYMEAVLVMLLSHIGNIFEDVSLNRSHNLIIDAIDIRPKIATLIDEEGLNKTIQAEDLQIDDVIVLKVGEVVPVDGVVIEGHGTLDTSSITGEFIPQEVTKDSTIYSGSILKSGSFKLLVTSTFNNSTTAKILEMVVDSNEHKSKAENFISKFARVYTPIVVLIGALIALFPPLIISLVTGNWLLSVWYDYLYVALTFLVIACPCAIVISVPLAFFTGIGLASKNGIIVKGANYLDRLNEVKLLVSDKTGTLTSGEFSVNEFNPFEIALNTFKEYLFACELYSTHPIAEALKKALSDVELSGEVTDYYEKIGFGVTLRYKNHQIVCGNSKIMSEHGHDIDNAKENLTTLHLLVDDKYSGYVTLDDTVKENAKKTVLALSKRGIETLLLTGGNEKSAALVAGELGIKQYHSELLPEQKIEHLKNELNKKKSAIAFMGDGVNDAPSIILADVGIAMGALGSDVAIMNADVVLMNDDPYKFVQALDIAKATRRRAITCISIALFIKIGIMITTLLFAIFDIAFNMMWIAVLADTGLTILLVLYAVLLIKKKIK